MCYLISAPPLAEKPTQDRWPEAICWYGVGLGSGWICDVFWPSCCARIGIVEMMKTLALWIKATLYVKHVRCLFFWKSWLNYVSLPTGWKLGESVHIEGQQGAPRQSHLWEKPGDCGRGEYFQVLNKMPITHWDLESGSSCSFIKKTKKTKKNVFFSSAVSV